MMMAPNVAVAIPHIVKPPNLSARPPAPAVCATATVKALQGLSETNDHFHLGPSGFAEIAVSNRPYRSSDKLLEYGKILFRIDAWDAQYFPHVLDQST